jgi:hypothetical protein
VADDRFIFNGIDGASGRYLLAPLSAPQIARVAQGLPVDAEARDDAIAGNDHQSFAAFVPREGVDPKSLSESGWGVLFAHGADPAIREALQPLLDHRKAQAARIDPRRYREFVGPDAYRPGERKQAFLTRHGAAASGPADPDRMPYYLLIVGDPEQIPFEFQSQFDLQYAVGRIHFDRLDDYASYARSVVAAETRGITRPQRLAMFAARNPDDPATALSADGLIGGLIAAVRKDRPQWQLDAALADDASKQRLARLLGGGDTPSLLFTASHGMGFPNGDPRQLAHQGALLCQDWPGPAAWQRPIPPEFYFSADDLPADADLHGLIALHFACYGGGTPRLDPFYHRTFDDPRPVAPRSFLARLPMAMLAHPRGGALAIVAHVDRAWACSFHGGRSGPQIETFTSTLKRLLDGHPIGSAMDYFGSRYAELSSDLSLELEGVSAGARLRELELADLWTANNDARNYLILGDPAVRLASPTPLASEPALPQEPIVIATPDEPVSEPVPTPPFDHPTRVQQLAGSLCARLQVALDEAHALSVNTWLTGPGSRLAARTEVSPTGAVEVHLSSEPGVLTPEVWRMHHDSVLVAQAQRRELLKIELAALRALLRVLDATARE